MDKKEFKLKVKEYKGGLKKNAFEIGVYLHNLKKYKKAIKYFEEYITLKDAYKIFDAKKYIADYYYNGLGVKKDISKAIQIYDDISFIHKDVKPIVIRYYYNMNDYSKIIYKVKDYIDTDIDALRFYCDYYKKNNSMSYALPYVEMLADKTKDEDVINDIVEYYSNYYAYCQDKQKVKDTLMKYSKNPKAALKLGQLYFYGIDCDQDYKEAYKYFSYSHKKGNSNATPYIGYFRYNGIEEKQNINSALLLLRNSSMPLSRFYVFKHRVETNENLTYSDYSAFEKTATECGEAAAYLVKLLREKRYKGSVYHSPDRYINIAVNQNIPEGFLERGIVHFEKKEYTEAYNDLSYAYERNQKEASIYLSKLLKEGLGCRKSTKKAEQLLNESNDVNSIYIKAMDLLKDKQIEEGIKLLTSIMEEHQEAKYEVATRYIYNSKDKKEQEYGYKLLCNLDTRIQKYNYTFIKCVYFGLGTKPDYTKFSKLISAYIKTSRYEKDKLDKELDYIVGEAYYKGNGLVKNNEEALKYLGYSKDSKYKPAIELYNEVDKVIKELKAIEEEKRRKLEEERLKKIKEQKALEEAKKLIINELFKKYKDYRVSIPNVKSIYSGYGELSFTHEVDEYNKTATIVVRGSMNYHIYLSENDKKNIAQNIFDYVKPYVEEFYKKYPDYPMDISIKHEFTIWHNC